MPGETSCAKTAGGTVNEVACSTRKPIQSATPASAAKTRPAAVKRPHTRPVPCLSRFNLTSPPKFRFRWKDEERHTVPQAAQACPAACALILQNLMKSNSLLKHLAVGSVKRTQPPVP